MSELRFKPSKITHSGETDLSNGAHMQFDVTDSGFRIQAWRGGDYYQVGYSHEAMKAICAAYLFGWGQRIDTFNEVRLDPVPPCEEKAAAPAEGESPKRWSVDLSKCEHGDVCVTASGEEGEYQGNDMAHFPVSRIVLFKSGVGRYTDFGATTLYPSISAMDIVKVIPHKPADGSAAPF